MSIEDTFNGTKNAYAFYYAFFNTVAQDIGLERTIALESTMCENMGTMQGQMIKEQSGMEEFDARAAYAIGETFIAGLGISTEVMEESPQKILMKVPKCPIYEAALMLGLEPDTIEQLCRTGSLKFMDTMVKQLNPNLTQRIAKFRSTPDDSCVEEILLT